MWYILCYELCMMQSRNIIRVFFIMLQITMDEFEFTSSWKLIERVRSLRVD